MKRIWAMAVLCGLISSVAAENYKVLKISNPPIMVGGKELKVGDTFSDSKVISWDASRSQALKVETKNHKQLTFRSVEFKESKSTTLKEFITNTRNLSVRGTTLSTEDEHKAYFSDSLLLFDSVRVETKWRCDENNFFELVYTYNGREIRSRVPLDKTGTPYITRSMFAKDMPANSPIRCFVYYKELEYEDRTLLSDSFFVILL